MTPLKTYKKILFVLVVYLNVTNILSRDLVKSKTHPCPLESEFLPCVCTFDEAAVELNADCSNAKNNDDIARAFQSQFSFDAFQNLNIDHTECSDCSLTIIDQSSFGPVSFVHVTILHTAIATVGQSTFQHSDLTLEYLDLSENKINDFTFEAIGEFEVLKNLILSNNKFAPGTEILPIRSESLQVLNLSKNTISYNEFLVRYCPKLKNLNLADTQTLSIPMEIVDTAGMFTNLEHIDYINFSKNSIDEIPKAAVIQNGAATLGHVLFAHNNISKLHQGFIKGFGQNALLDMSNNQIQDLEEIVWSDVVLELKEIGTSKINFGNNPLRCGCEVAWLVRDESLMNVIIKPATCYGGSMTLHSIPPESMEHCP